jgi:Na+-driven multidrug efflux pump
MQCVSVGKISGLNLMDKVKWVSMINYWAVGIPLSYFLMFKKDMALEGLWYGPTVACLLNYVSYEIAIRRFDW